MCAAVEWRVPYLQVVVLVDCAEALQDAVDFATLGEVGGPRDDVQMHEALGEQLGGGAADGHGHGRWVRCDVAMDRGRRVPSFDAGWVCEVPKLGFFGIWERTSRGACFQFPINR